MTDTKTAQQKAAEILAKHGKANAFASVAVRAGRRFCSTRSTPCLAPRRRSTRNSARCSILCSSASYDVFTSQRTRAMRAEQTIHRAVVQHLRARGVPGLVFLHPANGGARKPIEAAIFKSLGVRPGAANLLLWHEGKSYALELKADGGRVTKGQREFLSDMEGAGAYTCLAEGLDDAIEMLEAWGLLRSKMQ